MKASDLPQVKRARKFLDKVANANQREKAMTLTMTQFDALFENHPVCYYSGEEFSSEQDITLERLDASLGYVDGNVVLCSAGTNKCKAHLDSFEKYGSVSVEARIRMMRKSLYRLEKEKKRRDAMRAAVQAEAEAARERQLSQPKAGDYFKMVIAKGKKQ